MVEPQGVEFSTIATIVRPTTKTLEGKSFVGYDVIEATTITTTIVIIVAVIGLIMFVWCIST